MARTRKHGNGTGRQAVVGRYFRGLPVVDATDSLRVVVIKQDIRGAKRLDPNNCVFAQACRRLFDSHAVLILRSTAYVELPDDQGNRVVNRFIISNETRDKIAVFDKTGEAPEGGFVFNAPVRSQRMDSKAKYHKEYARDIRNGDRSQPVPRGLKHKRMQKTMLGVRDGRGKLGINFAWN